MRDDWSTYFLKIAFQVATRATCDRLHVGCVLVQPETRSILSTGFNGSVRGADHCDDVGHDMDEGHCVRTVHAEANAIAQAACVGTGVRGAWAYVTHCPCWPCARLLLNAGISRIFYATDYRVDERVRAAAGRLGVEIELVSVIDPTMDAARVEQVVRDAKTQCRFAYEARAASSAATQAMELEMNAHARNAEIWRGLALEWRRRADRVDPAWFAASSQPDGITQDAPAEAREERAGPGDAG